MLEHCFEDVFLFRKSFLFTKLSWKFQQCIFIISSVLDILIDLSFQEFQEMTFYFFLISFTHGKYGIISW